MDHEYNTLSLAKAYESQGYYQDAKDIYDRLNETYQGKDTDIQAACTRMKKALENAPFAMSAQNTAQTRGTGSSKGETRVAQDLEKWLRLLILKKRLGLFKRIQARIL